MRIRSVYEVLLRNLNGEITRGRHYCGPEAALKDLVTRTGVDFGYDSLKWRAWLLQQGHALGDAGTPGNEILT